MTRLTEARFIVCGSRPQSFLIDSGYRQLSANFRNVANHKPQTTNSKLQTLHLPANFLSSQS